MVAMKIVGSATSGSLAVVMVLLGAAICAVAAEPMPLPLVMENDTSSLLSPHFYQVSCPNLHGMVREVVDRVRRQDVQVTAGLLRMFFHDCLPQGCDASIFLAPERIVVPNDSLQPRALQLIENIREQVHETCGPVVSCADILALATREAVRLAGGPFIVFGLGRKDSLRPASSQEISTLPSPFDSVDTILQKFRNKGLRDPADVVALSGGHTVGKASCKFIRTNDFFTNILAQQCSLRPSKKQNLDVTTPDAFDNRYFINLRNRQGVLPSDQALLDHPTTKPFVNTFADNEHAFFVQFGNAMGRLSLLRGAPNGEIRRTCFSPNRRINVDEAPGAEDEGLAASA